MYTLLIADDERLEREALRYIITRESNAVSTIIEAKNGKEAVERTTEHRPDIVFLDIKMPGINGLDAARRIRAELPTAKLVFLTAFDYFDYAHEAIRIGVQDFIVKPATDDRVMEVIERLCVVIATERETSDRLRNDRLKLQQAATILENELIDDLIQRSLGSDELDSYLRALEIDTLAGLPVCMAIDFDSYPMAVGGDARRTVLKKRVLQRVKDELANGGFRAIGNHNYTTLYLLVLTEHGDDNCRRITGLLHASVAIVRKEIALNVSAGIGEHLSSSERYTEAFAHARVALESTSAEEPVACWKQTQRTDPSSVRYPYELERTLTRHLLSGDADATLHHGDEMLDALCRAYPDRRLLTQKLHEMFTVVTREAGVETDELPADHHDMVEQIEALASPAELRGLVRTVLRSLLEAAAAHNYEGTRVITDQVKRYIEEHYSEDLSLEQAAAMARLSPYYFSRMFKRDYGTNFIDFVHSVRVRHARELLRESLLSIKEIAQAVGFSDANYFTRVFKRHESMTPSVYRGKTVR